MAICVICCYFLPFLFFFLGQIAFPDSIGAFLASISGLSISSLILYLKSSETTVVVKTVIEKEQVIQEKPTAIKVETASPLVDLAKIALKKPALMHLEDKNALIDTLKQELTAQKELFQDELDALCIKLQTKDETLRLQAKEIEDLKFELYTALRIESYTNDKKLLTASF